MSALNNKFKDGQWEVFELITSTYFGKQYYFLENDERIYIRYSQKYMSLDEAISEFCAFIYIY